MTRLTLLLVTALVATATAERLGANGHGVRDGAISNKVKWGTMTKKAMDFKKPPLPSTAELKPEIEGLLQQLLSGLREKAAAKKAKAEIEAPAVTEGAKKARTAVGEKWSALKQKLSELKADTADRKAERNQHQGDGKKWSFLKGMFAKLKEGKKGWGDKKDWGNKKDWLAKLKEGKKGWGDKKKDRLKKWRKKGEKGNKGVHRPQWSEAMWQAFSAKATDLKASGEKVQWHAEKARFVRSYCAAHAADAFCARPHPTRPPRHDPRPSVTAMELGAAELPTVQASPTQSGSFSQHHGAGVPPLAVAGIVGAVGLLGAAALVAVRRHRAANAAASTPSAPVVTPANQVSLMPVSYEVSTQEYSML